MSNHPNRNKRLSINSKIMVRWTTCPADLGYGGVPTDWATAPAEIMGVRQALGFRARLADEIGTDTDYRDSYQHCGRDVSLDELREITIHQDHKQ